MASPEPPAAKKRRLSASDEPPRPSGGNAEALLAKENLLSESLRKLTYPDTVTHIYDPVSYAVQTHRNFLSRFAPGSKKVLFLGMNPGPFGMAQNGVPFGDTAMVTEFLSVTGDVEKPAQEHPNRPISGLHCTKKEVSGTRFWGLVKDLCGCPEQFFKSCFVHNYCPLCFMTKTGKNVTPPMLKGDLKTSLQQLCDQSLLEVIELLQVEWVVGVGKYAADRAKAILKVVCENNKPMRKTNGGVETFRLSGSKVSDREVRVFSIMHPSPINPASNVDWAGQVKGQLETAGLMQIITA